MDVVLLIEVARAAVACAGEVLDISERLDARPTRRTQDELKNIVFESTKNLGQIIRRSTDDIVKKIERDKMEELNSRTRNLARLIRAGNKGAALHYAMSLKESVDYAGNRVAEEKLYWIGPWIAGSSAWLAALRFCGEATDEDVELLEESLRTAKYLILDEVAEACVKANLRLPWDLIQRFLTENSADTLDELPAFLEADEDAGDEDDDESE